MAVGNMWRLMRNSQRVVTHFSRASPKQYRSAKSVVVVLLVVFIAVACSSGIETDSDGAISTTEAPDTTPTTYLALPVGPLFTSNVEEASADIVVCIDGSSSMGRDQHARIITALADDIFKVADTPLAIRPYRLTLLGVSREERVAVSEVFTYSQDGYAQASDTSVLEGIDQDLQDLSPHPDEELAFYKALQDAEAELELEAEQRRLQREEVASVAGSILDISYVDGASTVLWDCVRRALEILNTSDFDSQYFVVASDFDTADQPSIKPESNSISATLVSSCDPAAFTSERCTENLDSFATSLEGLVTTAMQVDLLNFSAVSDAIAIIDD